MTDSTTIRKTRRQLDFSIDWTTWGIAFIIEFPDLTGLFWLGPFGLEITEERVEDD